MAEEKQNTGISAAFPAPPPFYKHFTEANLTRYAELQASHPTDPSSTPEASSSLLDLPPELRYLRPPSPPPNGRYRSFGEDHSLSTALPPLPPETPLLYPSPPTPPHLIQLTRSLLLNFLELLHILATNPSASEYGPKWEDLRDLFRNAHQAVNEYRPHQAREALILLMEGQVERGRREGEGMREVGRKVGEVLRGVEGLGWAEEGEGLGERDGVGDGGGDQGVERRRRMETERRMWEFLRGEVGA